MRAGWQHKTLGELCRIRTGKKDVNQGNPDGEYPFFTCAAEHTYSDSYSFDTEALLIAGNGDVGKVSYYNGKFEAYQRTYVVSDFVDVLPRFLYLILDGKLKETVSKQKLGNTMPYIKVGMLTNFTLPLPPLPEQQRIVSILDEAFEGIATAKANAEKNLQNARALFESHLQAVFSQRGDGWGERHLGDNTLLEIVDGDRGVNYPKADDFLEEGHCLFMNTKNVRPDGFDFESTMFITEEKDNLLRKGKLKRDDVVMTTRGTIGNIGHYSEDVPFHNIRINSGMLIFRPNKSSLLPSFLFEMLRSEIVKEQIRNKTTGAAQPQLPIKTLVNFKIPVPRKLEDQHAIVKKLREFEPETQRLESIYQQKLAALDALKKSLLDQAFKGEL